MDHKEHYLVPLLAGFGVAFVFAFLMGAIGSIIPGVGCCVCLAATLGSVLSIYMLQQKVGEPIEMKEAAIIGTLIGGALFVIFFGLSSVFIAVVGASAIPGMADMPGDAQATVGGSLAVIIGMMCGINLFHVLFGALGGVAGAAIFKNQAGGGGGGGGAGGWQPPGGGASQGGFGAPPAGPGGGGTPPPGGGFGPPAGGGTPTPGGGGFGQPPGGTPPPGGGFGQPPGGTPPPGGGFGQPPGGQHGGGFGQPPGGQQGGGFGQPPGGQGGGQGPQGGGWGQQ